MPCARNRSDFAITVAAALAAVFAAAAPAQNLLINGSFEQGPPNIGPFISLDPGSVAMPGWIVTRGQIDLVGSAWQNADGSRSLDLNGSPGSGGVAQSFATTPGRDYLVSFFLAGNGGSSPAIKSMVVAAAGHSAGAQFDNTGTSFADMKWRHLLWAFTANSSTTTIELYSAMPGSFGGPAIDDVLVRPASCVADLNYDGYVDDGDFVTFVAAYNALFCPGFAGCAGDFNFDGAVDDSDFVVFVAAYNTLTCE